MMDNDNSLNKRPTFKRALRNISMTSIFITMMLIWLLLSVTSVLTLCLYALCSVTLWKLTTKPGWRLLAVGGAVFSAFAVAAAAGGYIWPSVGFFAATSLAWLWVRKRQGRAQGA